MARYIDADALARWVHRECNPYGKPTLDYKSGLRIIDYIADRSTADVAPVRHGKWCKPGGDIYSTGYYIICSACNKAHWVVYGCYTISCPHPELEEMPPYCPNCGAKMDGGGNE